MNTANSIVSDRNGSRRNLPRHPVSMPQALPADFGKTPSQRAIVDIIGEFLPRYGYGAEVLHVGDPAMGCLVRDEDSLRKLGLSGVPHEKLPAIVAYSPSRGEGSVGVSPNAVSLTRGRIISGGSGVIDH